MLQLTFVLTLALINFQLGHSFGLTVSKKRYTVPSSLHVNKLKNIEFGSKCKGGSDPDRPSKVNQDACFIHHVSDDIGLTFLGVFDGHGKKGHILNDFLSKRLPQLLEEKSKVYFVDCDETSAGPSAADVETLLIGAFDEVNEEARLNTEVPAGRSGTTCIVSIIDRKRSKIHTANVGDSRAIIGMKYDANDDSDWTVIPLTEETTAKRDEERLRIESAEGRIDSLGNVWYGPIGIAMTRSLGNVFMRRAGVISTPEVNLIDLEGQKTPCTIIVALGTDGIFDVISNEDTIRFIEETYQETKDLKASMDVLVDKATKRWSSDLPVEVRIDDMTIVSSRFQVDN